MRPHRAGFLTLAILLSLAGVAAAQQPTGAPPSGAPSVQSAAPEVGGGRGGQNAQPPEATERHSPTGQDRSGGPEGIAPRPARPVTPIPAPPPFTAQGGPDAAEVELQHALRGGVIQGMVSIPNQSAGILIQPEGRDWRGFRNRTLTIGGAAIMFGVILVLGVFYFWKGPTRIDAGRSGRSIQRYGLGERINHWMVATSFVVLALTGLNITFGAYVLRPVIGAEAFTALTWWGQAAHQYLSFPFVLGLLVMLAVWARDNLPSRTDIAWLKAGGPISKGHPPAGRFNAAQKGLYWFVIGGGALAAISGYLLMAPAILDDIAAQQWAHTVHGVVAMIMIAAILGHIYIGSIGTEGAFEAMSSGRVDYNYAREHHGAWVEERLTEAQRSVAPPGAPRGAKAAGAD